MDSRAYPPSTLIAIGDVHRIWREVDAVYLERQQPDLAMFVGDLGDEDVEIVERIARVDVDKAVILGNHDAWRSFTNKEPTDALRDSLDVLGDEHIAYNVRDLPAAGVSIVGARPFSWGGQSLRSPELYDELYGVRTMRQSAAAIVDAARDARFRDLIILAHNGPLGLGSETNDIYGKDFGKPGGDWGDYDLQLAIERIERYGLRVRAVVAGHMHHRLLHPRGAERRRFLRRGDTLFVNCAVVPRVVREESGEQSYFVRMKWQDGECLSVEEVWVDANGNEASASAPEIEELEIEPPDADEFDER